MAGGALAVQVAVTTRAFPVRCELRVDPGETVAVVGPSGAGKTTLLAAVAGLVVPDNGRITLGDETWFVRPAGRRRPHVDRPPHARAVGMVFQDYALFPHLTVRGNIAFGLRSGARRMRATELDGLLERFGLAELADARPAALSGGERQRVALVRALARHPGVLLLDEPLSALDAHTRASVRRELASMVRAAQLPTLLVTHDARDVAALADRVVVLDRGAVMQTGTLDALRAAPATPLVAALAGAADEASTGYA